MLSSCLHAGRARHAGACGPNSCAIDRRDGRAARAISVETRPGSESQPVGYEVDGDEGRHGERASIRAWRRQGDKCLNVKRRGSRKRGQQVVPPVTGSRVDGGGWNWRTIIVRFGGVPSIPQRTEAVCGEILPGVMRRRSLEADLRSRGGCGERPRDQDDLGNGPQRTASHVLFSFSGLGPSSPGNVSDAPHPRLI